MDKRVSVGIKLSILIGFALLFAASMIGLSMRERSLPARDEGTEWGPERRITRSFAVAPGGTLFVDAAEGSIAIAGGDGRGTLLPDGYRMPDTAVIPSPGGDSGVVTIVVTARGSSRRLNAHDITFDQSGNTVRVESRDRDRGIHLFHTDILDVHYDITVPRSFNVDLRTTGGNLAVRELKGTVNGETSGGDLDVVAVDGTVKLSTSGGNVDIRRSRGEITLETSGGNMTGEGVEGNIHLETSGGNIGLTSCDGRLYGSTSGGNIRAALKDNKGIELSTSGGNLSVFLPRSAKGDVRAEASGGDVRCDFPFLGKIKEGKMNGSINGGGPLIRLETSGGDIVLNTGADRD